MASKVNIDAVSESLSEVLKKADEFNIKKRSILENIKEIEQAIPLFERLVGLYESVGEDDPRAKTYFRLAQQIASRNDEGNAAGYNDLKWEAKQADAVNATDRLSNEEAEAIGKLARSSKLSEFVMEFDIENLERFRQFKELIKAVTEQTSGMSRKDALTRRVANIRDILREYGTARRKYPANDPYGTLKDGDTPFYPVADEDETKASNFDKLPALANEVGQLQFRNGKWYRLESVGSYNGKVTDTHWKRVSDKKAQKELGPSEYATIRRRGELEEKAVASIEKTSRYIADLEPAGSAASKKEEKKKKDKKKKDEQSWGDALLQLAKWASYGVATLGAIAGAAALVPKLFELVQNWNKTNKDVKEGAEKFINDAHGGTPTSDLPVEGLASDYDKRLDEWAEKYANFQIDDIQGNIIPTGIASLDTIYENDTMRRALSITGLSRGPQFKADILRAYAQYKKTGDPIFYSTANDKNQTEMYHLGMFSGGIPGLTEGEKAALEEDYRFFDMQQGLTSLNARPGWSPLKRGLIRGGATVLGSLGAGYLSRNVKAAGLAGVGGYGLATYWEANRSDFKNGKTLNEYKAMTPQEQAQWLLDRYLDTGFNPNNTDRQALALAARYGTFPTLNNIGDYKNAVPLEALGELVVNGGFNRLQGTGIDLYKTYKRAAAILAMRRMGVPDSEIQSQLYEVAIDLRSTWLDNIDKAHADGAYKDMLLSAVPTREQIVTHLQRSDDFTRTGDLRVNQFDDRGATSSPTIINQSYVTQTNVVADDNAQQVGGKQ